MDRRGASYREIAATLGRALYTIKRALDPEFKKEHNAASQKWKKENPEKAKACTDAWRESQGPGLYKRWYRNNRTNRCASVKKHYEKNKKRIHAEQNERRKERRRVDPQFRIAADIRSSLSKAYKSRQQDISNIGCTGSELRLWLDTYFQPGMEHYNYGEWQFDHIKPLSSFDLTIHSEFLTASHFTNIQPLWKADHHKKSASELT